MSKVDLASDIGIAPGNSGAQNSAAYAVWAADTTKLAHTILFDGIAPGANVYKFDSPLAIPTWRRLEGASFGVKLQYVGPGAEAFIYPSGAGPIELQRLTISARDGSTLDGLCEYIVKCEGSLSPNVAGPTLKLTDVSLEWPSYACVKATNIVLIGRELSCTGGAYGLHLDSCSESFVQDLRCAIQTQAGVYARGSLAGAPSTNGCKLTLQHVVVSGWAGQPQPYGLYLEGVANAAITGMTVEGATDTAFYIANHSSNVHITKSRSNSGRHVVFDNAIFCRVEGGCTSGQAAYGADHINGARNCRAALAVESGLAHVDVVQKWGGGWQGWRRDLGGPVLAVDDSAPSSGYWEKGDRVVSVLDPQVEWVCRTNGSPGIWEQK